MKKIVLLAYNGELSCFAHVMLYALDLKAKGHQVEVVLEGAATALIPGLAVADSPFAELYRSLREKGLIACICRACSQKMGTLAEAERQGLNIVGDMQGHPSIEAYVRKEYTLLSF
jgi:hypothetical protein